MLTESVKGMTKVQAEDMFSRIRELMMTGKIIGDVGKLEAFSTVYEKPVRIKCAILPWHALSAALKDEGSKPVSTENEQT